MFGLIGASVKISLAGFLEWYVLCFPKNDSVVQFEFFFLDLVQFEFDTTKIAQEVLWTFDQASPKPYGSVAVNNSAC